MADGVDITPGTGTKILTDDCGASGHAQGVKLAYSADATATFITADAKGLQVQQATAADLNARVVGTGTFVTQVDGAALTALQLIDDSIFADDAAFTVGTNKVTVMGGVTVAHGSAPDAADAGDAAAPLLNRHRVQFTIGGHPNIVSYGMSITTAVSNTVIGPTIGSGAIFVVTALTVVLDNASAVFPTVVIGFGAANTPAMATTPGTAKILLAHPAMPAGGGVNKGDGSGIVGIGGDGEEVRITTTGNAGGAGLYITMSGYTIET